MDWKLAMEEERAMLKRIVALLFALADLAESASGRSRPVRAFVLWLLRPAEAVARDFIIGSEMSPTLMPVSPTGDGPADALRLAQSFHDLACELECQASLALAIQEDVSQTGLERFGADRLLDIGDFLNTLRLVFATIARQAAYATGPPDTS